MSIDHDRARLAPRALNVSAWPYEDLWAAVWATDCQIATLTLLDEICSREVSR